jgi:hypothetical protein
MTPPPPSPAGYCPQGDRLCLNSLGIAYNGVQGWAEYIQVYNKALSYRLGYKPPPLQRRTEGGHRQSPNSRATDSAFQKRFRLTSFLYGSSSIASTSRSSAIVTEFCNTCNRENLLQYNKGIKLNN